MRLRTRFFLWVGSIFLLAALGAFLLPYFLVKGDVRQIAQVFANQLHSQRVENQLVQHQLFEAGITREAGEINGMLLTVIQSPPLLKLLNPNETDEHGLWKVMSDMASFNPKLGLTEISQSANKTTYVLAPDNATAYHSYGFRCTNNIIIVLMSPTTSLSSGVLGPYLAMRFPMTSEEENVPIATTPNDPATALNLQNPQAAYYLYPISLLGVSISDTSLLANFISGNTIVNGQNPPDVTELYNSLTSAAKKFETDLISGKITNPIEFATYLNKKSAPPATEQKKNAQATQPVPNAVQIAQIGSLEVSKETTISNAIRSYIALLLNRLQQSPLNPNMPLGINGYDQKFDSSDQIMRVFGLGFLNSEIFFTQSLFNAQEYYRTNPPLAGVNPIANGVGLIDTHALKRAFVANTLLLNNVPSNDPKAVFVTFGSPLSNALSSSSLLPGAITVFLRNDGSFRMALDNNLQPLLQPALVNYPYTTILSSQEGDIIVGNTSFHFMRLEDASLLPIYAYLFVPNAQEPLFKLQSTVSDKIIAIYHALSSQLFTVSIVLLSLALIILHFLAKKITQPIVILADATEKVVQGNYSEIKLPKMEVRKDEIGLLSTSFEKMVTGLIEKEKIRGVLDKVVSKEIAAEVLKGNVHLGGEDKLVTILFSDIRNFTKRTEHKEPELVITHLNTYMTLMTKVIEKEGGVIDKYVGDEVMALYGAPIAMPDGPQRAVKTALLMMSSLKKWNEELVKQGHEPFQMGIGIHTGKVVAGNMGAETRLNYTVLGANVNLAARLCAAAEPMQIRISKETLEASGGATRFEVQELPAMIYKGFSEPLVTYAILGFKE